MCFKARNVDIEKPGVIFCVAAVLEGLAMVAYGTILVVEEQASGDVVEASYLMGMAVFLTTAFVYFALDAVVGENKFQLFSAVLVSILTSGFVLIKYLNTDRSSLGQFWVASRLFFLLTKAGFSLLSVVLSPFVLESFGYRAFRVIGTDGEMIRRYSQFLQMWTMLRLDLVVNLVIIASCESNVHLHTAQRRASRLPVQACWEPNRLTGQLTFVLFGSAPQTVSSTPIPADSEVNNCQQPSRLVQPLWEYCSSW